MSSELAKVLTDQSGGVIVAAIFAVYIYQRDQRDQRVQKEFMNTLADLSKEAYRVHEMLSTKLQVLYDEWRLDNQGFWLSCQDIWCYSSTTLNHSWAFSKNYF